MKIKTYSDEDPELLILSHLIRHADHNRKFPRDFIDDVYEYYDKFGYITQNQYDVLKKIYDKHNLNQIYGIIDD